MSINPTTMAASISVVGLFPPELIPREHPLLSDPAGVDWAREPLGKKFRRYRNDIAVARSPTLADAMDDSLAVMTGNMPKRLRD